VLGVPPGRYSLGTHRYWAVAVGHPTAFPFPDCVSSPCRLAGTWLDGTHVPVRAVPSLQHAGNLKAVAGGVSQLVLHAPVEAPVYGSKHGAHRFPAAQVDCSSDGWAAMDGRQVDRQRPGAPVPGNGSQDGGM
jgi:hypothetical protein